MQFFILLQRLVARFFGYFRHLFTHGHRWGYGIHSPFLYRFYHRVLAYRPDANLKDLRRRVRGMKRDRRLVSCSGDYGAGPTFTGSSKAPLGRIVRRSSVSFKQGKLLYACARELQPATILELGTSVGVSTLYLCQGAPRAHIYTLEGCPHKQDLAGAYLQELGCGNITPVKGPFEKVLPEVLHQINKVDMAFIDGDHRQNATIRYFNMICPYLHANSLLILDDIHWSKPMSQAWQTISQDERVRLSIDLYRMGMLFFKEELSRQSFKIRY